MSDATERAHLSVADAIAAIETPQQFAALEALGAAIDTTSSDADAVALCSEIRRLGGVSPVHWHRSPLL